MISVIMSTYNEKESELRKSINSILDQTYGDFEFIIINDNPNNQMLKVFLAELTDERIRILENETNLGLVASLNKGVSYATGEYIARMDADDISYPDRFEKQLKYLTDNNLDLIGSWFIHIDESEQDNPIKKYEFPVSPSAIKKVIKYNSCLPAPSWFGKREVFVKNNGYRNYKYCEDYDFLLRAVANGFSLGNYPDYLLRYRIRQTSISVSNKNKQLLSSRYLGKNHYRINEVTKEELEDYLQSSETLKELEYMNRYDELTARGGIKNRLISLTNKYVWIRKYEMLITKLAK